MALIDIDDPDFTVKIKISEDVAKMRKPTSVIVISFSVLSNDKDPMSSIGKRYSDNARRNRKCIRVQTSNKIHNRWQ